MAPRTVSEVDGLLTPEVTGFSDVESMEPIEVPTTPRTPRQGGSMKRRVLVAVALLGVGAVLAYASGLLQSPFAPTINAKDKVELVGNPCDVVAAPPAVPPAAPAAPCTTAAPVVPPAAPVVGAAAGHAPAPPIPPPGSAPPKKAASPQIMGVLANILKKDLKKKKKAKTIGKTARLLTPAGQGADEADEEAAAAAIDNAIKDQNGDEGEQALKKYHDAIDVAVEDISKSMEVEDAADQNLLVTSEALQAAHGLDSTPEVVPYNLVSGTSTTAVDGDMCFESGAAKERLLSAKTGRRLWAGNLWPNKGAIPYCYAADITDKAKRGFHDALQHVINLVPCMAFTQVAVTQPHNNNAQGASGGKCADSGIYVQSFQSQGCWSFVGRVGAFQQLNLGQGCESMGIAAHELLHALGMAHEQARTDYGRNIVIYWNHLEEANRNNYDTSPNADLQQPYDIMSLMHYGDTDFGINGQKTMKALDGHRGIMGNRMGMTAYDAAQLAAMYQCEVKKFNLCTNDITKSTCSDCTCHQGADTAAEEANTGNIKITVSTGCYRCMAACLDDSGSSCTIGDCGCGQGQEKKTYQIGGGKVCYQCAGERIVPSPTPTPRPSPTPAGPAPGPSPTPRPSPTPAPAPTTTPAPKPCKFDENGNMSPDDCPGKKNLPGCTTCDGDNAWCFAETTNGWRYCTKADNHCTIPFTYEGVQHWTCTEENSPGVPWCMKVGGGAKRCDTNVDITIPTPAPPTTVTPAPLPEGCKFPFSWSGYTFGSTAMNTGCLHAHGSDYCVAHDNTWRHCHSNENLCYFPFTYGDKTYTSCAEQAGGWVWKGWSAGGWKYDNGYHWCYLAGGEGGWKKCA